MITLSQYLVDAKLYRAAKHNVSLTTTEYFCGDKVLVHLRMGRKFVARLNMQMQRHSFITAMPNERFLFKGDGQENAEPITKGSFVTKLKKFDESCTVIEKEIIEKYIYVDKNGFVEKVQIIINEKDSVMTASIEFRDYYNHYKNFAAPDWLIPIAEQPVPVENGSNKPKSLQFTKWW